jgi:protein-S-isoprenylcysteine O-methyltransferase Ste14
MEAFVAETMSEAIWRVVPLAIVTVAFVILRWRIRYQVRRYGGEPMRFVHGKNTAQRVKEKLGSVPFAIVCIESGLVAAGYLQLAPSTSMRALGAALGFGGLALMVQAQLELGASWRIGIDPNARPGLVTHGWYRFSRNPIFLFMLISWCGLALLLWNVMTAIVLALVLFTTRRQVMKEEAALLQAYGEEYREYARRVGRFVPVLGRHA